VSTERAAADEHEPWSSSASRYSGTTPWVLGALLQAVGVKGARVRAG
jgi:hypothetical protein